MFQWVVIIILFMLFCRVVKLGLSLRKNRVYYKEIPEELRKLHTGELYDFYSSLNRNTVRMINSVRYSSFYIYNGFSVKSFCISLRANLWGSYGSQNT